MLYRNGLKGILIEPNRELIKLSKIFRKKDIAALAVGCADYNGIATLYISKTPVLSSFNYNAELQIRKVEYLPLLTLDNILKDFKYSFINFLSIDVEGLSLSVLRGAYQSLTKTLLLCIEYDNERDILNFDDLLNNKFERIGIFGCNILYLNKNFKSSF